MAQIKEACMYTSGYGFGDGVPSQRFPSTQANSDDARLVFNEKPDGFAAEFPLSGQFGNAEVRFESGVFPNR